MRKFRIIEDTFGIFYIETYKCLKEYGCDGFWYKVISYNEPFNELNYFKSLEDAESAISRMMEKINNESRGLIIHKEYLI